MRKVVIRLYFAAVFALWGSAAAMAASPQLTSLIISVI